MITIPGLIPIRIHPFFWILAMLIGWINTFNFVLTGLWVLVILGSVLIHEFGHALTALAFGQRAHIDLVALGGVTKRHGSKLKLWQEFIVVLNGPLAGFALGLLSYLVYKIVPNHSPDVFIYFLEIMIFVNLFWTVINLLPVQPLDGGHLLNILLEGIFGLKGLKISLFLSMMIAAAIAILFFAIQQPLVGALFLMFGFESYRG
jgi:stage IV sporulation protein FB